MRPPRISLQLRLTPEEYEMLQEQAGEKGLPLASFLKMLIHEEQRRKDKRDSQ